MEVRGEIRPGRDVLFERAHAPTVSSFGHARAVSRRARHSFPLIDFRFETVEVPA